MEGKYSWRMQVICTLPILVLLLALRLGLGTEREVAAFFAAFRPQHPFLTRLLIYVTDYGNYCLYCMYVYFLFRGMRSGDNRLIRFFGSFVIAFTITLITVYFLKAGVGRARPYLDPGFSRWLWQYDYSSFPSGHTTEALIAVIPVAIFRRKWRVALGLGTLAATVAFTRAYLSVHYLTDLIGGTVMGNLGALLTWALYAHWLRLSSAACQPGGANGFPGPETAIDNSMYKEMIMDKNEKQKKAPGCDTVPEPALFENNEQGIIAPSTTAKSLMAEEGYVKTDKSED